MDIIRLAEQGKLTASHMSKMFRTKYVDWKYEREVRVFARLDEMDKKSGLYFHDFDYEMMLTDIFIGPLCKITEADVGASLQSEDSHVNIVKTRMAHKTFDVVCQNSKN